MSGLCSAHINFEGACSVCNAAAPGDGPKCERCEASMIERDSGTNQPTYPPSLGVYWWCGCGNRSDVFWRRQKSEEELARERWEARNLETSNRKDGR